MITLASDNHHKSLHTWPLWLTVLIVMTAALTWPAMKAPILLDDESSFRHVSEFTGWSDVFKADAFGLSAIDGDDPAAPENSAEFAPQTLRFDDGHGRDLTRERS